MVVTSRPWASSAKIRQESTVLPSSSTVQAPHRPHYSLLWCPSGATLRAFSRSSDWRGSIATSYGVPFTVSVMRRFHKPCSCLCGTSLFHSICNIRAADSVQRFAQHFYHVLAIFSGTTYVRNRAGLLQPLYDLLRPAMPHWAVDRAGRFLPVWPVVGMAPQRPD